MVDQTLTDLSGVGYAGPTGMQWRICTLARTAGEMLTETAEALAIGLLTR